MPPKRKAASARGRGAKKAAVSRNDKESEPEDASKHVETRLLAPISLKYEQEDLKNSSRISSITSSDPPIGACERVILISGSINATAGAILSLTGEQKAQILVPEAIVMAAQLYDEKNLRLEDNQVAKLDLSNSVLPMSNERVLGISVLTDDKDSNLESALKQALELLEQYKDNISNFPVVEYVPRVISGIYGRPDTFRRQALNTKMSELNQSQNVAGDSRSGGSAAEGQNPEQLEGKAISIMSQEGLQQAQRQADEAPPGQLLSQQIYIPIDMIGAIIGKGGSKINEIRQMSGSAIKINEDETQNGERMVTVTGSPEANQTALYLIYQKIDVDTRRD